MKKINNLKNISNGKNVKILSNRKYLQYDKSITSKIYLLILLAIVLTLLAPQVYAATYTNMKTIPSTCTGGSIVSDVVNGGGGRVIACSGGSGNLTTITYNKPGDTNPTYFEMNKQSSTGSGVQVCLLGTCISNNGYAKSPNFPISDGSGNVSNVTTGTISLTSTPGGASVALNGNSAGTTSAGASGSLNLQNVPAGSNSVAVSLNGYQTSTNTLSVTAGQTSNLNVLLQPINSNTTNSTGGTSYTNMRNIPSTCNGGTISSDTVNGGGGRVINCTSGANSLSTITYNKPGDANPTYFEMYKQTSVGSGLQVCLLTTCISNNGFAISPNFPIIGQGNSTNSNSTGNTTNNSTGNITLTTQPGGASVTLNGNNVGTTDPITGILNIVNAPLGNDAIVASKTNYANAQVNVNVASGQISTQFLRLLNTNPANQPPQSPTWLEPPATGVYPNDFHLHTNNANDSENDAIIASDFEIWDVPANQAVWASYKETVDPYHIHIMDGTFMGNLAGQSILLYNHTYEVRARFYEYAQFNNVSNWSSWRVFQTIPASNITVTAAFWTPAPGYVIQKVTSNVNLPVNVEMAPNLYTAVTQTKRPLLYVTQLYGQVGVILNDGTYQQYAGNLLGTPPPGGIPGGGEAGVDGLYVDQTTGDLYVSMSYTDNTSITGMSAKVIHFKTNATGNGFSSSNIIIDKLPVRPSHEAHTILKGPDGKMYLSIGDGDQLSWPQDPTKPAGKVLRLNWDGTKPTDNPFNGTYTYAQGFRNPFGMAFRPGTNELYVSNNGQDTDDGLYKTFPGSTFGWPSNLTQGVWVNWHVEIAPTQVAFDANNAFPNDANNVYVVGSGSTYLQGPSPNSKRIFQIPINPDGSPGTQTPIATYTGAGYGDPIGLTFAPDGAYFTDIYGDAGFTGAGVTQGNIYKIMWTGQNATINQTNTTTGFSTVIAQHPWYPQGLNMIWDCKPTGGSGNYIYDYVFGDGNQQLGLTSNNVYVTYPAHGTYTASCTVHDTTTGQQTSGSTTLTI